MLRRRFLGTVTTLGSVALAGCGDSDLSDWFYAEPATPERIARITTDSMSTETGRAFAARIAETGGFNLTETQLEGNQSVPADFDFEDSLTRLDGSVYNFTAQRVRTVTYREQSLELWRNESGAGGDGVVPYEELPAVDRRVLAPIFRVGGNGTAVQYDSGVDEGRHEVRYRAATANRSQLVGENPLTAIRYNGSRYDVTVEPSGEEAVDVYHYGVEGSWTLTEFAARTRDRHMVTLTDLSEAKREVLETAIDEGEYAVSNDDDAAESLRGTLQEYEPVAGGSPDADVVRSPPYTGPYETAVWLVEYEGTGYLVEYVEKTYDMA